MRWLHNRDQITGVDLALERMAWTYTRERGTFPHGLLPLGGGGIATEDDDLRDAAEAVVRTERPKKAPRGCCQALCLAGWDQQWCR